jgi:phosphoserine phosphatase
MAQFMTRAGMVDIDAVGVRFGLSKGQLAASAGLRPEVLRRRARALAPRAQTRIREMLEIVGRVAPWAGGPAQAMAWFRSEPLPAFGARTAESLVKDGKADAVRDYLDHVALGGFA